MKLRYRKQRIRRLPDKRLSDKQIRELSLAKEVSLTLYDFFKQDGSISFDEVLVTVMKDAQLEDSEYLCYLGNHQFAVLKKGLPYQELRRVEAPPIVGRGAEM